MRHKKEDGRPEMTIFPADRATVQCLAALGCPHRKIAQCIGKRGISEPTLRKHFRRELDVSDTEMLAAAGASLMRGLKKGEQWATMAVLKCKAGWKETTRQEHSGPDGGTIDLNVSTRELLAARIAGIAARGAAGGTDSGPH